MMKAASRLGHRWLYLVDQGFKNVLPGQVFDEAVTRESMLRLYNSEQFQAIGAEIRLRRGHAMLDP